MKKLLSVIPILFMLVSFGQSPPKQDTSYFVIEPGGCSWGRFEGFNGTFKIEKNLPDSGAPDDNILIWGGWGEKSTMPDSIHWSLESYYLPMDSCIEYEPAGPQLLCDTCYHRYFSFDIKDSCSWIPLADTLFFINEDPQTYQRFSWSIESTYPEMFDRRFYISDSIGVTAEYNYSDSCWTYPYGPDRAMDTWMRISEMNKDETKQLYERLEKYEAIIRKLYKKLTDNFVEVKPMRL